MATALAGKRGGRVARSRSRRRYAAPVRLRVATCLELPEPDADAAPLAAALAAAGIDADLLAWDDPTVDWDAGVPTLLRSTWNYPLDRDGFVAWCARVERAAPLFNDAGIVRDNSHKGYLLGLAARGVPIAPTVLVRRGAALDRAALAGLGAEDVVVKPAVGAGSRGVRRIAARAVDEVAAHVAELAAATDVLLQPYLRSVEGAGERSLIFIDGELTHAIRKARRLAGDAESITGPFPVADDERAVAERALSPYRERVVYGRVDLARDQAGRPVVMELELIEPSLFFRFGELALARLVAALRRRLAARPAT
jgi:glutathione synthase/RimK-type ligase-like ATP-grasp enzyme